MRAVSRPAVDVVVPFAGSRPELEELGARLRRLKLGEGDSVLIVDNTSKRERRQSPDVGGIHVLRATERSTPGFARNRGAAKGSAPWLVFLDADTEPTEDLLDRYFDPPPSPQTAMLGGGVRDQPVPKDGSGALRYAYIRSSMSQENTFKLGSWSYPTTSNVAVLRPAFEAAGGFREDIRAAEDADLSYRLRASGWAIERREPATVVHRSRPTLWSLLAQKSLHGAGGGWLNRQYPGCLPPRRRPGLVWWAVRTAARGFTSAIRSRDRDRALWAVFEPVEVLAWEFGRSLPNTRPLTPGVWWQALRDLRHPRGTPRI
jgi:cellulose synthase/poly-beta-1,6-N-acetylglucosamine synthase-like glycosyltransferase